jgi:hypothetical protein
MAYRKPSVAVYQELENSGGAASVTPDLQTVIIGPLYNEVKIDPTDETSLANAKGTDVDHWLETGEARKMLEIALNGKSTYPGQKVVDDESIRLYLMNVQVKTYAFTKPSLSFAEPTTASQFDADVSAVQFGFADANPLAPLAIGDKGPHVRSGDLLIASDGTTTVETTISSVKLVGTTLTLSVTDSLEVLGGSEPITFEVYRLFTGLELNIFRVNPADVDVSQVLLGQEILKISNQYQILNTPVAGDGSYTLRAPSQSANGKPVQTYIGYRALRTDKSREILTIEQTAGDLVSKLGEATSTNPLALGVSLALKNTTTSIRAVAIEEDSVDAYQTALQLIQNERLYSIVPLTSKMEVLTMVKAHVEQMSDPETAMWRIGIVSSDPSDVLNLGTFEGQFAIKKSSVGDSAGRHNMILSVPGESFLNDGIQPGDMISIITADNAAIQGTFKLDTVYSNTTLGIKAGLSGETGYIPEIETHVTKFEILRNLDNASKAKNIAAISSTFKSKRIIHVMPCLVGITENSVIKYLPSYYLAAAVAGCVAGFPVQQGLTNLTLAGIDSLQGSNFYFSKDDLNTMAAAGTMIFVQDTQSAAPYCRHELTTDMSVLEYRELLKVKNWDYLSYFYHDILNPFIGQWNIVEDTLRVIRQTVISASENLKTQKLPRIGAPLVSYEIAQLAQDTTMKDKIQLKMNIAIVDPNNYTDVHLVI